jgi:hypothetical protein
VIRRYFRSKNNFWNIYRNIVDKWYLIYNSDLHFIEFAFGQNEDYVVNDDEFFMEFIKDIQGVNHES